MHVLTMNAGGSSLKVGLLDVGPEHAPGERAAVIAEATTRTIGGDAGLEIGTPDGRRDVGTGGSDRSR